MLILRSYAVWQGYWSSSSWVPPKISWLPGLDLKTSLSDWYLLTLITEEGPWAESSSPWNLPWCCFWSFCAELQLIQMVSAFVMHICPLFAPESLSRTSLFPPQRPSLGSDSAFVAGGYLSSQRGDETIEGSTGAAEPQRQRVMDTTICPRRRQA